jgi:hypothetical protein
MVQGEIAAAEAHELPDGYRLRFPGKAGRLVTLAEFIHFARAC